MQTFVAICSKNGQRVSVNVVKPTIEEARDELHKQGYAIIEIKEAAHSEGDAGGFFFEILIDGKKKNGTIKSDDMFKAYRKLVKELGYQVIAIYDDPKATEEEKAFITNKLKETYVLSEGKKGAEKEAETDKDKKPSIDQSDFDPNSVLAQRVKKYQELILKISEKIDMLLLKYSDRLEEDRIAKLKELSKTIRLLKNITNPDKLKLIGEAVLEKIGELEIELIERNFADKKGELLKDTNGILRQFGSSKKVILPEEDFMRQVRIFWQGIVDTYFTKKVRTGPAAAKSEASSEFMYFKNVRELKIYEAKRDELKKEMFKGLFTLRGDKRERMRLKLKMIEQNVELLGNRINNRSGSYVKMKRGISATSNALFYLVRSFGDFLLY